MDVRMKDARKDDRFQDQVPHIRKRCVTKSKTTVSRYTIRTRLHYVARVLSVQEKEKEPTESAPGKTDRVAMVPSMTANRPDGAECVE